MKKLVVLAILSGCVLATNVMAFTSSCPTTATIVNGNFVGYGPNNTKFVGPTDGQTDLGELFLTNYWVNGVNYNNGKTQILCDYANSKTNQIGLALVNPVNGVTIDPKNPNWMGTQWDDTGRIIAYMCQGSPSTCQFSVGETK